MRADPTMTAGLLRSPGRWLVIVLMVAVAAVSIRQRIVASAASQAAGGEVTAAAAPVFQGARFQVRGTFVEELGGFPGTVLAAPSCSEPIGVLAVRASYSAMSPAELRWQEGRYSVQYIYDGVEHDQARANFTLPVSNVLARAMAAFGLKPKARLAQYLKVFVPEACAPLGLGDLRQIEDALSG